MFQVLIFQVLILIPSLCITADKEKGISKACIFYIFSLKEEKETQSNTFWFCTLKKKKDFFFYMNEIRIFLLIISHFSLVITRLFSRIQKHTHIHTHTNKKLSENEEKKNSCFLTGRST